MLTSDLVRARLVKGVLQPGYIDPDSKRILGRAEELIAIYSALEGLRQGQLDEALGDHLSEGGDLRVRQGLAKLLHDRCDFESELADNPAELRREVFLRAGRCHPVGTNPDGADRENVLREAADARGLEPEIAESGLYADLKEAQVLRSFDSIAPQPLLHRYNVALAQAVLFKASRVVVDIADNPPARYRQLFRYIKFYQLSFRADPLPTGGYRIELDGPMSLFRLVQRYGLNLAKFLPALLLLKNWRMEAQVQWGKQRRKGRLQLSADDGLVSHYKDRGAWVPDEQNWFAERFAQHGSDWELVTADRIVSLGGRGVLVPDYILRHPDGREALLEIVWTWRSTGIKNHARLLTKHGPPNLILAVSENLRVDEAELPPLPEGTIRFKKALRAASVVKMAERVGQ